MSIIQFKERGSRNSHGFTLIEVLVSMIIITIGLLGVASMQLTSFQNNQGAYMRSQATVLATDFMDRIRSNPQGRTAGAYNNIDISEAGDVPDKQACITSDVGCPAASIASNDIYEWAKNFYDMDQQEGYKPTLPAARATVSRVDATDEYIVTVFWQQKDWVQDGDDNAVRGTAVENFVQLRTYIHD